MFGNDQRFYVQKEIGNSSWFGFSFILRQSDDRARIIKLLEDNGIETRPIVAGNFAKNEVIKWMHHEVPFPLKNSEYLDSHGFFVGNHHYDISEKLNYLKNVLQNI